VSATGWVRGLVFWGIVTGGAGAAGAEERAPAPPAPVVAQDPAPVAGPGAAPAAVSLGAPEAAHAAAESLLRAALHPDAAPDVAQRRALPPPADNDARSRTAPPVPPLGSAEARAKLLVLALRENEPPAALPLFFPRADFPRVKGIGDPDRYYRRLVKVYLDDVRALRGSLRDPKTVEFLGLTLGRQKRWVVRGAEANALPYWAVYRSSLRVRDAGREKVLPLRVMIAWDGEWYITHLTNK